MDTVDQVVNLHPYTAVLSFAEETLEELEEGNHSTAVAVAAAVVAAAAELNEVVKVVVNCSVLRDYCKLQFPIYS